MLFLHHLSIQVRISEEHLLFSQQRYFDGNRYGDCTGMSNINTDFRIELGGSFAEVSTGHLDYFIKSLLEYVLWLRGLAGRVKLVEPPNT